MLIQDADLCLEWWCFLTSHACSCLTTSGSSVITVGHHNHHNGGDCHHHVIITSVTYLAMYKETAASATTLQKQVSSMQSVVPSFQQFLLHCMTDADRLEHEL